MAVHSQCHCEWTLNGTTDAGLAPDVWPPLWHVVRSSRHSDSSGQVCVEVAYCCKLGLGMLDIRDIRHGGRRDSQQRRPRQCGGTRQHIHVGKSPSCRKLGLGVREIMLQTRSWLLKTWCEEDQCRCRDCSRCDGRRGWHSGPCARRTASSSWYIPTIN